MKRVIFGVAVATLLFPAAAFAARDKTDHDTNGDPNRVICRSEPAFGTRLTTVKRCHTAAEWAQIRREVRMTVDRVQNFKPTY